MPIFPGIFAFGDSPEVELPAAATVDIAPPDNSVDTNRVRITGTGTITSFGIACGALTRWQNDPDPDDVAATDDVITVTKRIAFVPTVPGPGITLTHNPPGLVLLGAANRTITKNAFGEYQSDVDGNWTETNYSQSEAVPTTRGGGLLAFITYVASATITIPPGATRAWVRMWGSSGASGNGIVVGQAYASAGVGAPGYLEKFLTGLTPGNTLIFTRGAAGTVVSDNGTNGSASILAGGTQTIGTLTANGSNGTPAGTPAPMVAGSPGGTASGGDINLTGQQGGYTVFQILGDGFAGSGWSYNTYGGVGGVTMLARGPNGNAPVSPYLGNPGIPGGLIIAWFNDAFL